MSVRENANAVPGDAGRMYAIGLVAFILFLSTLVGFPVLPRLSRELGADSTDIPMVVSSALVTVVVLQFFTGALADYYSRKTLILAGALLGSVTSVLCAVATHWWQLLFLRIAGGAADAIAMPALLAMTASLGQDRPGRVFGILRGSQGLSYVVGPVIGSALSLVSLRTPFIVDGFLSLAVFVVAFFVMPRREKTTSTHRLAVFASLGRTFSNRRVYLYILIGVSGLFGFGILSVFVATKADIQGLEPWHIGIILGFGALVFSVVSFAVGRLSDRISRRALVIASELMIILGVTGLYVGNAFWALVAYYGLFCVGEATVFLLAFVYASKAFASEHMGASMGAFDSVMDLSLFVGPVASAALYERTGMMGPVFVLAALPALLALACVLRWPPEATVVVDDAGKRS